MPNERFDTFPPMTKAEVDALLAGFDADIARGRPDLAWWNLIQDQNNRTQMKFALQNRGITLAEINRMSNLYNSGAPPVDALPPGFRNPKLDRKRDK